jgi:two-component system response regulator DesR
MWRCSILKCPERAALEAAAEQLHAHLPACKVLILTTFGRPGYLHRAMEQGVVGFLVKDAPAAQLAAAIRRAVAGERVVDPLLAIAALSEGENPLTEREQTVLQLVRQGASNAEIASALALTEGTVRNYLSTAMQKVQASTRIEAAVRAEQKGWL